MNTPERFSSPPLEDAGIPPIFRSCTFDTLDPSQDPEAHDICRHYAHRGEYQGKRGLLLRGQIGNGKTCLAVAILHQVLADTHGLAQVRFWEVTRGLLELRRRRPYPDRVRRSLLDLAAHDLVVLDGLGIHQVTPWVFEQLYLLLDELWAEDRQVIITTNLPAAVFVHLLDPVLVSRILGLCHEVLLTGPDRRR